MAASWDQARIQSYIDNGVQESVLLDYKRAASLGKQNDKRTEVTKDVSAMANSAGGLLIYGVAEYARGQGQDYLPEKIDPIDVRQFSREWLEQVINLIRPRIEGVTIHLVPLDTAAYHAIYVVDIPQSDDAHQAADKCYYKRFNFMSVAMEDYEIRDVMARAKHPRIELDFRIYIEIGEKVDSSFPLSLLDTKPRKVRYREVELVVQATNQGSVLANFVKVEIELPTALLEPEPYSDYGTPVPDIEPDQSEVLTFYNTDRDVVDVKTGGFGASPIYGPSRYVPILPKSNTSWSIELHPHLAPKHYPDVPVKWRVFADNAPFQKGEIMLGIMAAELREDK